MASTQLKCEYCGNYRVHSPDGKERICLQCLDKERILGKQIEY